MIPSQEGVLRPSYLPSGLEALVRTDGGSHFDPQSNFDWSLWVSGSRTRNYALDEPLLDWFDMYGEAKGFVPDTKRSLYDLRTDFSEFIMSKGEEFETAVMKLLYERLQLRRIAHTPEETRFLDAAERTFAAMQEGVEIITQAILRNPDNGTYGAADALVRSDILHELFPEDVDSDEIATNAPALGSKPWHYKIVDVKFHTLELLQDGSANSDVLPYMAQVWIYNEALGRIQGYIPPAAYLLGRNWKQGAKNRGQGTMERIARVDRDRRTYGGDPIAEIALNAVEWIVRLRQEGDQWNALPTPSVPELYPNMKSNEDAPWHAAKKELADQLRELTLLPGMTYKVRNRAHAKGLYRWDDPRAEEILYDMVSEQYRTKMIGVLRANQ